MVKREHEDLLAKSFDFHWKNWLPSLDSSGGAKGGREGAVAPPDSFKKYLDTYYVMCI